jgi:hypothetical protein
VAIGRDGDGADIAFDSELHHLLATVGLEEDEFPTEVCHTAR